MAVETLTTRAAETLDSNGALVVVDRAAPAALQTLRSRNLSFVTQSGEWHIVDAPELVIVRSEDRPRALPPNPSRPLSRGTARIARWLLLNKDVSPTVTDLARETTVSEATSSRAVAQLAARALIETTADPDARRKVVSVIDPASLLDALANETAWWRARRTTWDIGAATADDALTEIRRATRGDPPEYAIGELAGAALRARLVEPATVTLWIDEADHRRWEELLLARPSRPAAGRVVARLAPDPQVLRWGETIDNLRVADPVQLYIDCHHAGERAIDAADSMAQLVLER